MPCLAIEFTLSHVVSFAIVTTILIVFSVIDVETRKVPNKYMIAGMIITGVTTVLTGHLFSEIMLHLIAFIVTGIFVVILFRIGALGGADAKSMILITLGSPGIEFVSLADPIYEAILGTIGILLIMLVGAIAYSKKADDISKGTPLLPFMLIAYLLLQAISILLSP